LLGYDGDIVYNYGYNNTILENIVWFCCIRMHAPNLSINGHYVLIWKLHVLYKCYEEKLEHLPLGMLVKVLNVRIV
jgi:hypothetical protein